MTMLTIEFFNNTNYLANILLFAAVARIFRTTIDIDAKSTIKVHIYDGTSIKFKNALGAYIIMMIITWKITLLTTKLLITLFLTQWKAKTILPKA